jgi:hypothetical protein
MSAGPAWASARSAGLLTTAGSGIPRPAVPTILVRPGHHAHEHRRLRPEENLLDNLGASRGAEIMRCGPGCCMNYMCIMSGIIRYMRQYIRPLLHLNHRTRPKVSHECRASHIDHGVVCKADTSATLARRV